MITTFDGSCIITVYSERVNSNMGYFWMIFQSKYFVLQEFFCMDLQSEIDMYHVSIVI